MTLEAFDVHAAQITVSCFLNHLLAEMSKSRPDQTLMGLNFYGYDYGQVRSGLYSPGHCVCSTQLLHKGCFM
eukprot:1140769-Pelagomonas_calceolata.AAC.8